MELKDAVAKRVLELCKEYNIKPSRLGKEAGLSNGTMEDIVHARYRTTQLINIYKICDYLKISLKDSFSPDYFVRENVND